MSTNVPLLDARGCLSPQGVAELAAAPPGKGPPELAAHVVNCARCQARLLAHGQGDQRPGGPTRPPTLARTLLVAGALVAALLMALFTLVRLAGS